MWRVWLSLAAFGLVWLLTRIPRFVWRALARGARFAVLAAVFILALVGLGNFVLSTPGDAARSLDPGSEICRDSMTRDGWDVLVPPVTDGRPAYVANDEWDAIDKLGSVWRRRFACAIQRHAVPDYADPAGTRRRLTYDLAFIEFQEDGKPHPLRQLCADGSAGCVDRGYGPVARADRHQIEGLLDHLCGVWRNGTCTGGPHYVIVFVHGWRHNAAIGDSNVSELRHYAAHVARFLADRKAAEPEAPEPRVTALFVGWRGARVDETRLRRALGKAGEAIGTALALGTLFDRKPVSEAVAPAVYAGLRSIEQMLGLTRPPAGREMPPANPNRMIVFGHSLGGNMLATTLRDDLIKKVGRHDPGSYMAPPLGDLVVLINPASEATKWTDVQRAVWRRIAMSLSERRPGPDYGAGHDFFHAEQRPIVISATAARNWPPGGLRELDCDTTPAGGLTDTSRRIGESRRLAAEGVDYDWATYDLFPAFKGDLRPVSDTIQRALLGDDPQNACDDGQDSWGRRVVRWAIDQLRFVPFQQTDPEQTRTIGHYDPPRTPRGRLRGDRDKSDYLSGRPFGTTHELRGRIAGPERAVTRDGLREAPIDYEKIAGAQATCPSARNWLTLAREKQQGRYPGAHAIAWASSDAEAFAPALNIQHGFSNAGLSPITRANDPFWNMRAFDTALARHDGYMLTSFICAMNQLVMDEVTGAPATTAAGAAPPAVTAERAGRARFRNLAPAEPAVTQPETTE